MARTRAAADKPPAASKTGRSGATSTPSKAAAASKTTRTGKTARTDKAGKATGADKPAKAGRKAGAGGPAAVPRTRRTAAIRHWSSRRGRAAQLILRSLAALLLSLCAIEIMRLTLTPSPASVGIAHANLHPFATIRLYLRYGSLHQQILQIGGNVAIGVPLGFLLPQITPRLRGTLRVVLVTVVFVTLLELAQWLFVRGRAFDVDDIILAAVGAVLGYLPLGRMFSMRLHPYHLHWWQRMLARNAPGRTGERVRARQESRAQALASAGGRARARREAYSGARAGRSSRSAAAAAARRAGPDN